MLRDFSNKFAIGASLALAILLSAGLVQAVVTDDVNFSVVAPEGVSLGSNATSEVAGGMEDGNQSNLTEPLSEVGGEAAANETAPPMAAGAAEVPAAADTANETLPEAANVSGAEIIPAAAGGELRAVCLNGCSYTTIQAAIDAAVEGDVVEVGSGTYRENVIVDKRVTIRGVNTGEGVPVVDAQGNGSAVLLKASGVFLEGLTITNAGPYPSAGIEVVSRDSVVAGCAVMNSNWAGIYLKGSANTTISRCISSNNGNDGILVFRATGNLISESVVSNNLDDGIALLSSDDNRIEGNLVANNTDVGIFLDNSKNAVVTGNVLSYNAKGISLLNSGIDRVGPNRFFNNTVNLEGV